MAREFTMGARINLTTTSYTGGMADAIRATNAFAQQMSATDNTMGRYYDSQGRLREQNGRYARSTRDATLAGNTFKLAMRGAVAGVTALAAGIGTVTAAAAAMAQQLDEATGKIQAMTGVSKTQAKEMTAAATDVYAQGWGPSIAETADAMAGLKQQISGITGENAKEFIKSGFILEQAFQAPVAETTKVVKTMMQNFDGLGSSKAFDIITKGFQLGGNYADDMLDTINEYSVHFAGMGMSADQMMGTLIAGSQQGAFMLDKVGDSVKETFIRMQDGSESTKEGFKMIGLDANKMAQDIAMGGDKANSAFQATLLALGAMKDPLERERAGVMLFGTQWEDMGDDVVLAMNKGMKGLGNFKGATDKAGKALQDNLGAKMGMIGRMAMVELAQIGAPIVESLKEAADWILARMPAIMGAIGGIVNAVVIPAFNGLKSVFGWLVNIFPVISPYIFGVAAALITLGGYFKFMQMRIQIVFFAMRAFFALMTMNPITLIAIGIGLLIGYLIRLAGGWGAVKQKIAEFLPTLKMIGTTILNMVMPVLKQFAGFFVAIWQGLRTQVLPVLNSIIMGIVSGFKALVGFIREHWNIIGGIILIAWTMIATNISIGIAAATAIVKGGFALIGAIAKNTWGMIQSVIKIAWSLVSGIIRTGLKILQGDWKGAWKSMLGALKGVWSGIKGFFKNLKGLFYDSGKAIIKTLVDGIKAMASAPVKAVEGILDSVRDFLPFSDAKRGPLSQLTYNGGKIITTMAEGMYKQKGVLAAAMDRILMGTPQVGVKAAVATGQESAGSYVAAGTANPAGSTSYTSSQTTKSIIIEKLFEKLEINGVEGKNAKEIALEVIAEMYELLKSADEIEAEGLGGLLK